MTVPRSEVHARLVRRRRANRGRGSTPYKKNPIGSTILIAAATAAAGALAVYLVNRLTTKPSAPPALVVGGTAPDAISKAAADAAAAVRQAWEQKNNVMEGPTLGVGGDGAYSNGVGLPHGGGGRGHGGGHPHGGGHGGHGHHGGHGRRHGGRGWGWNGGGWVWGENWPSTIVVYACPPGYVWDEFGNCVPIVVS